MGERSVCHVLMRTLTVHTHRDMHGETTRSTSLHSPLTASLSAIGSSALLSRVICSTVLDLEGDHAQLSRRRMLDCQLDNARHDADTAKPATTTGTPGTKPKRERVKLMGIRQHLEVQRVRQQEKQEPDHWFVRKVRRFSLSLPDDDPQADLASNTAVHHWHRRRSVWIQLLRLRRPALRSHDPHAGQPLGRQSPRTSVVCHLHAKQTA